MAAEELYNYIKVSDEIVTAGQPTAEQLKSLAAEGFSTVINLATVDPARAPANEAELVRAQGLTYYHIPVDWENPQDTDFATFEQTMLQLPAGKTLIHCAANYRVDRFLLAVRTEASRLVGSPSRHVAHAHLARQRLSRLACVYRSHPGSDCSPILTGK